MGQTPLDILKELYNVVEKRFRTKLFVYFEVMMFREICKSKIHRARVTDANLNYTGSITIARDLMDAADLVPYEKVQVVNINNGTRFETYVIEGESGTGTICLNGAAARLAHIDDLVIVISYAMLNSEELKTHKPRIILLDKENRIVKES